MVPVLPSNEPPRNLQSGSARDSQQKCPMRKRMQPKLQRVFEPMWLSVFFPSVHVCICRGKPFWGVFLCLTTAMQQNIQSGSSLHGTSLQSTGPVKVNELRCTAGQPSGLDPRGSLWVSSKLSRWISIARISLHPWDCTGKFLQAENKKTITGPRGRVIFCSGVVQRVMVPRKRSAVHLRSRPPAAAGAAWRRFRPEPKGCREPRERTEPRCPGSRRVWGVRGVVVFLGLHPSSHSCHGTRNYLEDEVPLEGEPLSGVGRGYPFWVGCREAKAKAGVEFPAFLGTYPYIKHPPVQGLDSMFYRGSPEGPKEGEKSNRSTACVASSPTQTGR